MAISDGPSVGEPPGIGHEAASSDAVTSLAAPCAKRKRPSVPAPRTNQVVSSWLLATSPRSSAWSSFFCVGSKASFAAVVLRHRRATSTRTLQAD